MFENRALEVRMVRKDKNVLPAMALEQVAEERIVTTNIDIDRISRLVKEHVTHIAVLVGCGMAGYKLLSTGCEIAVMKTEAKQVRNGDTVG